MIKWRELRTWRGRGAMYKKIRSNSWKCPLDLVSAKSSASFRRMALTVMPRDIYHSRVTGAWLKVRSGTGRWPPWEKLWLEEKLLNSLWRVWAVEIYLFLVWMNLATLAVLCRKDLISMRLFLVSCYWPVFCPWILYFGFSHILPEQLSRYWHLLLNKTPALMQCV